LLIRFNFGYLTANSLFSIYDSAPKNAGFGVQTAASSQRVASPLMAATLSKPEVSCRNILNFAAETESYNIQISSLLIGNDIESN
jgi:hypothetical protein